MDKISPHSSGWKKSRTCSMTRILGTALTQTAKCHTVSADFHSQNFFLIFSCLVLHGERSTLAHLQDDNKHRDYLHAIKRAVSWDLELLEQNLCRPTPNVKWFNETNHMGRMYTNFFEWNDSLTHKKKMNSIVHVQTEICTWHMHTQTFLCYLTTRIA